MITPPSNCSTHEQNQDETTTTNKTNTVQLSNKKKKALADAEHKELNLKRITEANKGLNSYDSQRILTTCPETKPFIIPKLHPNSPTDTTMSEGTYVEVSTDTSPGMNCPQGYGYVTKVYKISGTTLVADVKYTPAYDGGRKFKAIPLNDITVANLNQDMITESRKRDRPPAEEEREDEIVVVRLDVRTKTKILVELLQNNYWHHLKKRWHHRDVPYKNILECKLKTIQFNLSTQPSC